jgi:uncharacterized protein
VKKYAVITGASAGIGMEFARAFAKRGVSSVLVARSEEKLNEIASEIRSHFGVDSRPLPLDLADASQRRIPSEYCVRNSLDVGYLVNSAGYGSHGPFDRLDLMNETRMTELNCCVVQELSHRFAAIFLNNGQGTIINVASTAGFQPVPFMATYAATKAFVLSFSLALRGELLGTGVKVLAVCPGPVDTDFFRNAGMRKPKSMLKVHKAEFVVSRALEAAESGKAFVITGALNKILYYLGSWTPLILRTWVAGKMFGSKRGRV